MTITDLSPYADGLQKVLFRAFFLGGWASGEKLGNGPILPERARQCNGVRNKLHKKAL